MAVKHAVSRTKINELWWNRNRASCRTSPAHLPQTLQGIIQEKPRRKKKHMFMNKRWCLELDALRENILRFLSVHSSDHLSLTCTCRQLLQEVEIFSQKELDRITREHNVDDDWLYRAGMQAVLAGQQGAGWYIPSSVSQRRMLRSAYQTHIYSLGTDPSQAWTGVLDLAMHPDGKRILSGGHWSDGGSVVRLWDIQAKRCIRSFVVHSSYVDAVSFSAGCAISQAWEESNLRIWDLSRHADTLSPVGMPTSQQTRLRMFIFNSSSADIWRWSFTFVAICCRSSPYPEEDEDESLPKGITLIVLHWIDE
jgi:WD40 repeat protein